MLLWGDNIMSTHILGRHDGCDGWTDILGETNTETHQWHGTPMSSSESIISIKTLVQQFSFLEECKQFHDALPLIQYLLLGIL